MIADHSPVFSTFIWQDVRHIARQHEIKCVCSVSFKPSDEVEIIHIPYNLYSFKSKIRWRLENYDVSISFKDKEYSKQINKLIENYKPDVIHCQFGYEALKLFDNVDIAKLNIPVLISFRGYDASYKLRKKVYVKRLKEIAKIRNVSATFVCNYLKENLNKYGIEFNNSFIIYTGIDTQFFKREKYIKDDVVTFFQVGAFNDKKGQHITIAAFSNLLAETDIPKIKLVFIGDGAYLDNCRLLARSFGISDFVEFKGKQNREIIRDELQNADVFVHHSITSSSGNQEGIPNSIAEAMSMELPVISTYHAGIPELVKNNVNGILVNEKDIESYTKAMRDMLYQTYMPENRETIMSGFSIEKHIDRLSDIYDTLINTTIR